MARNPSVHSLNLRLMYCGFIVGYGGIRTQPEKIQAVQDWQTPSNVKELRSFLGLTGFYQRFIPDYAKIITPLTDMLRKDIKWEWAVQHQLAFDNLKQALLDSVVLAFPDPNKPYLLQIDASDFALGATLNQEDEKGRIRLIACGSRKLKAAEKNYPAHEKECLALVDALGRWRHYLLGAKNITVHTDNIALKNIFTMKDPSPRICRWIEKLSRFHLDIQHIPGTTNSAADALSRNIALNALTDLDWTEEYRADPLWAPRLFNTDGSIKPEMEFHDGRFWKGHQILVPESQIPFVIDTFHSGMLSGHWGATKTVEMIHRYYYFHGIKAKVKRHIALCDLCQRVKSDHQRPSGLLVSLDIPDRKWESITIDWIVRLPEVHYQRRKYDGILVVVDRATKMTHLIATHSTETAQDTARLLMDNVFRLHGVPRNIHSDRDTRLTSQFWQEYARLLDIKHSMSAAYHPQSNGQAERTVQTVKQLLRMARFHGHTWFDMLTATEMIINNAPIGTTKFSPFFLNYGFNPCIIPDIYLNELHEINRSETIPQSVKMFVSTMRSTWRTAKRAFRKMRHHQKRHADKHRRPTVHKVGDWVLIKPADPQRNRLGVKGTLAPKAIGPYEIIEQINQNSFRVRLPPWMRIHDVFHSSKLIPYRTFHPGQVTIPLPPGYVDIPPPGEIAPNSHVPSELANRSHIYDEDEESEEEINEDPDFGYGPDIWIPPPQPPIRGSSQSHNGPQFEEESNDQRFPAPDEDPLVPVDDLRSSMIEPPDAYDDDPDDWSDSSSDSSSSSEDEEPSQNLPLSTIKTVRFRSKPEIYNENQKDPTPSLGFTNEDVKLDPKIFQRARRLLSFKPNVDMFASYKHHQLPRYYSRIPDPKSQGIDAFKVDWNIEPRPYVNPPWTLIPKVLRKIQHDGVRTMMVVPHWPNASWWPLFTHMCEKSIKVTEPIYLDDQGRLRPKPVWDTTIGILNGRRATVN